MLGELYVQSPLAERLTESTLMTCSYRAVQFRRHVVQSHEAFKVSEHRGL
jgi:hypothetical protein